MFANEFIHCLEGHRACLLCYPDKICSSGEWNSKTIKVAQSFTDPIVVDKMAPKKSAETPSTGEIIGVMVVIGVPIVSAVIVGIRGWASYTRDLEDTSKPCDTNAYLDKAFSFHDRYLSYFNYDLGRFMIRQFATRTEASNYINSRVSKAKNLQKKLAESDDENYLKDLVCGCLRME
uniref:SEA domain-containing protein n=1 Tax=Steinernema glaseri TaxID=37863 RepID=A0A1I8ADG2_9BILA